MCVVIFVFVSGFFWVGLCGFHGFSFGVGVLVFFWGNSFCFVLGGGSVSLQGLGIVWL